MLLALAANTSFGGLPVLASLLARDNYLPHLFFLRADRQVYRYGVSVLALAAAALLVTAEGNTQALVPLFAIGVFVGFTLSQAGMVRHWREDGGPGWGRRAFINGTGAVLTTAALAIELISKFTEGAWLVVLVIPLLVLMFDRINRIYGRIGRLLEIGKTPPPPERMSSLVVVPVGGMSRLTAEGVSAALSLGDEVIAVTVCYADPEGFVLDRAIQEGTTNVVICRLRFRLTAWSRPGAAGVIYPDAAAQPQSSAPKGNPGRGRGVRGSSDDGG